MSEIHNPKYRCPCCNFITLNYKPPGSFDICTICHWEDDNIQFDDPDYEGGANHESLNQAKEILSCMVYVLMLTLNLVMLVK